MIGEEIGINEFLDEHSVKPIETDLGEYIIQLRHEPPSHIIAPAIHLSKKQVADAFREHHTSIPRRGPGGAAGDAGRGARGAAGDFCPPRSVLPAPTC